jgi:excisionase family DNA binding protein
MAAPDLIATVEPPNNPLLTAAQVAELLGVPVTWVYEQARRGRIPTVTLGRYRRFRREAIEAWVAALEAGMPHR